MVRKVVDVAAGVLLRADGSYLLGRRGPNTVYPGYWEFPGGKVEAGEQPAAALCRELDEELGIHVHHLRPWLRREHVYEHAHVRLHFFEVSAWEGELNDHVHSELRWVRPEAPACEPMLPANGPIVKALRLPRMMGITRAGAVGITRQLADLDAALADGLRLVQVREPALGAEERADFAREVLRRARPHGALVLINGEIDLAARIGADGVHLPGRQLAGLARRPALPWVGASCHTRAELERAAALSLDYALLGPLWATPTHPGTPGIGVEAFAAMIDGLPLPVFALGGVNGDHMEMVRDAGAHGIAAIRAAWERPRR